MRALLLAALALATPAMAQDPGSRPTREFVQAAAQSDMFEMLEGQAALTQSTDARVLGFARMMMRDHAATAAALREAADKAGLAPPAPGIGNDQAQFLGGLQSKTGADFDRTYATQQVLAHRAALVTQQGYAASGDTPPVRQAAAAAVPVIAGHLAMAEQLKATLGE